MRAASVVAVVVALLAVSSTASAGPPAHLCRHKSQTECERALGPYSAAQFLRAYVVKRVVPRLPGPSGQSLYCDNTKPRRPWVFRCGETVELGRLPSSCTVEAIIARDKQKVFHIVWLKESDSCSG
jgi:hypothetical protein